MPPEQIRELWQTQPCAAPSYSAADIRGFAALAGKKLYWGNIVEYAAGALAIAGFSFYIWHFKEWGVKVGSVMAIVATVYVLFQRRRLLKPDALRDDVARTGCLVAYLHELERIRYYMANLWKLYWGTMLGAIVFFYFVVSFESWALDMAPWSWLLSASLALLTSAITLKLARASDRRLKQLDDGIAALKAMLSGS